MRLWTLHPKFLDTRGLVALWREALLAQAVLGGRTRGYGHHPQLIRFRAAGKPMASIGHYLEIVRLEAVRRGYRFDAEKILEPGPSERIVATRGQLGYEWRHLGEKLRLRSPAWRADIYEKSVPSPHPMFRIVPGPVERWEKLRYERRGPGEQPWKP